jgi:hypothetical protein
VLDAVDVCISRIDRAPCSSTEIKLYKESGSLEYQKENEFLKIFLKSGSKDKMSTIKKFFLK